MRELDFITLGILFFLAIMVLSFATYMGCQQKKENEKKALEEQRNLELAKQNKKIKNLKEVIFQYPKYDKMDSKLTKLNNKIEKLQKEMDERDIKDYEWIRIINEKISILEKTMFKYISLGEEEKKEVKSAVMEMIKKIKQEVKEKENIVTDNQLEKEKKKFEEQVIKLDEVR